jgi:hypothetical protein
MTDYRSAQRVPAHLLYEDHDGPWTLGELARELRFEPVTVADAAAHLDGWGFAHRHGDLLWPSRTATIADRLLFDAV